MSKATNKALRAKRRAAGLCIKCAQPAVNKTYCEEHRVEINGHIRTSANARRKRRREAGLCIKCAQPAVNKTYCEEHRRKSNRQHRDSRARAVGRTVMRVPLSTLASDPAWLNDFFSSCEVGSEVAVVVEAKHLVMRFKPAEVDQAAE